MPIHIVKEMLGHQSISQTEEHALTEQIAIRREMKGLKEREADIKDVSGKAILQTLERMEKELLKMKKKLNLLNEE